ncbi:MAG: TolC family protein [Candidatus Omnitrophota bacterium]
MRILLLIILLLFCFSRTGALAEIHDDEALAWMDCVAESRRNNPDLISAEEAINQKKAALAVTKSGFYPQIEGSVSGSTTERETTSSHSGGTTKATSDSYSIGATLTQLLFDGSSRINDEKAASENIMAALYNYRFASSEVRLRLRAAFINLLKAQESLRLTEEIRKLRRDNLVLITLLYEAGMEHKGALSTAEANLAQAEYEIIQARRELETSQAQLIKEMGRSKFSPLKAKGGFNVSDRARQRPDFEALARDNPSLGKLNAQKKAAAYGVRSAEGSFLPEVSLSAGADRSSSIGWPPIDDKLTAGLSVSFPIFEGKLKQYELREAAAALKQAEADEQSEKDSVILALKENWTALQDAIDAVDVRKKFLEAAQERARIAEAQYSLGLMQFDNWTIIEDSLVTAKKSFLNAQADALLAEANWIQAKGETLEYAE